MAKGVPITQNKIKARKRKRQFWLVVASITFLSLIVSGLSFVSSFDIFQIKNIEVSGSGKESLAAEGLVEQALGGETLWFFPHSNIFFVSAKKIAAGIIDTFPSAASVSVSKRFFDTIIVDIKEKTPTALWCLNESCAALDQNGLAFANMNLASSSLIIFGNGAAPRIGAAPLSAAEFVPLLIFANDLPTRGIFPRSVAINQDGTDNILVATTTVIIVDPNKDLSQSLSNLDRLLTNKDSGISADNISSLQYLDLRFPDKIFYK